MKYKVELPKEIANVVVDDVFVQEDNPQGAVVVYSPMIISNGYISLKNVSLDTWNKSVAEGRVAALITKGIIKVEDEVVVEADVNSLNKQLSSLQDQLIKIQEVISNLSKTKVAKVQPTQESKKEEALPQEVIDFNNLGYFEKLKFIKNSKDVSLLKTVLEKGKCNKQVTLLCNKRIEALQNTENK